MTYKFDSQYAGYQPLNALSSTESVRGGFIARIEDPVWGGGEAIFARAGAGIRNYGLCVFTPVWDATNFRYTWNASEAPNTTLLGRPVGVAMGGAMLTGQFGWFLITGTTPINGTASVAADTAFGISAAGQVGALAAGKQIVSARVVTAATNTVVKAASGVSGDNIIKITGGNTDGFFVGGVLTGTGVGASAVVSAIDPLNSQLTVSVVNSAAVTGNLTQTANDATIFYNIANLNRSFAQGAIT
jgi:hypothetical protein